MCLLCLITFFKFQFKYVFDINRMIFNVVFFFSPSFSLSLSDNLFVKQTLGFGRESRVFLVDNGLGILTNPEDENLLDIQEQMGGVLVAPGNQSGLVQTPSALNRWMEEAIILDADSIHDCISALKPEILVFVEKQREEELAERKERRKKQQEEEAIRRKKEEEERDKNKENAAAAATSAPTTVAATTAPTATMEVAPQEGAPGVVETPSFSSFFHGFNMHSSASLLTSTPLVRSRDHAETLATSIVEAVLGPAFETVATNQPTTLSPELQEAELTVAPPTSALVTKIHSYAAFCSHRH